MKPVTSMRILFLTQVLPYPLDAGPKIRAYYVLCHLADRFEVTLVSFIRPGEERHIEHLKTFCQAVVTVPMCRSRLKDACYLAGSLLVGKPFLILRDTVGEMWATVKRLLTEAARDGCPYRVVHADQLWMAQYALGLSGVKTVLDQHNAVYLIPQRLARCERNPLKRLFLELEWRKLARYEAEVCQQFDEVVTVTEEDKTALLRQFPISNFQLPTSNLQFPMTVIPICIDPEATPTVKRKPEAKGILHLGTMFWPPNIDGVLWFAREVYPLVKREIPDVHFYVIGARPPREVVRLAERDESIKVTGYIEEIMSYIQDSAVMVVPLKSGGGMRVKILDAWARGIPVVSTSIGCEGIEVIHGENILVADKPVDFAQAVVRVICDRTLAQRLAENGRCWVESGYDWRKVYGQWDEVYEELQAIGGGWKVSETPRVTYGDVPN